ncbi:uncharacterized protein LOC127879717 isoform X1 [Dreissena polymorpha]|uniref:uncharacterized protein LOC127879717 isoform X1 n=1 Tax=Dreissena polymorpha TaxID=45954 RepID=UPI00226547C9|nr:uncharacterized protein LOC127879717 isoform X1 [Dreissena polymorpha]
MYSNEVWPSIKINRNCTINYASTERKGGKMYQQETTTVFLFGFFLNACKGADLVLIPFSSINVTTNATSFVQNMPIYKVNDGVVNDLSIERSFSNCTCCAALSRPSWVQLTLDNIYLVERVLIYGTGYFVHPDNNFNISVSMGLTEESLQEEQFTSKNMTFAEKTLNPPREIQFVRVTVYRVAGVDDDFMGLCEIMIYRQAAAVCEKSYYVLFAATLAVSLVLGVVLAAVIIFLVVYIRRRHHQSTGRISADTESSPQNDYEDLSTNRNHSNYDCLQMPTFEKPGRTENIARSKAASTNRLGQ